MWEPIPFQIDEKSVDGRFLYPFGDENDRRELNYLLEPQDEIVWMAADMGIRVAPLEWPSAQTVGEEIEISDPLTGEKGWCYVFSFPPGHAPPLSQVKFMAYDPEYDKKISRYYEIAFTRKKMAPKAVMEYYMVPKWAGGTGENFFDSAKLWIRLGMLFSMMKITVYSDDWIATVPAYIEGPIRVITKERDAIKLGLGLHSPSVDSDLVYYPHFLVSAIVIAIPFNPSLVASSLRLTIGTDLDHNATGMMFWNSRNPEPVIVDGIMSPQEKALDLGPDEWRIVSGIQGKYMGKAVYAGNFKMSQIKLDEGRYIDDVTFRDPPENEPGIYGSYNWTWDITHGKRGKYVVWIEAHYGRGVETQEDLLECLNVTDHPLTVRIGSREFVNCLLIPPPGFSEDIVPEMYRANEVRIDPASSRTE